MLIKIQDVLNSQNASLHDDGLMVYNVMKNALDHNKAPLEVSFEGVKRCTTLFLNASFGKLLNELGEETMLNLIIPAEHNQILNFDSKYKDMWVNVINRTNFQAYREEAHA
jgi:hypothetical protein